MLTRIEIDGFKTFDKFELDLHPLLVILGPNAAGKSNLFDAIQFLSRTAKHNNLRDAVKGLRGEPHELFRRGPDGLPVDQMRFAIEVLLDSEVQDPYGARVKITYTRLRYELDIVRRADNSGVEHLYVTKERVAPIFASKDHWNSGASTSFRNLYIKRGKRKTPYLETSGLAEERPVFEIRHDRHAGRSRSLPAVSAEATVLSSITSSDEFPTLFALREEMLSWHFLQLDPADLRRPSSTMANDDLEPSGSNLPTVLARIRSETRTELQPDGALANISADLAHLIPGVKGISVQEDKRNREYFVEIQMREGPPYSARIVSDGTLRLLAVLTLLHDPRHHGLVSFEEPENGVSPLRLKEMVYTFRDLVTNPEGEDLEEVESLRQMIVNSHSPVVLNSLEEPEIVFMDVLTEINPETKTKSSKSRVRKYQRQDDLVDYLLPYVTPAEIDRILSTAQRRKTT